MKHGDGKRVMICGGSGSGKSTLADQITSQAQRLIVFDYMVTRRAKAAKLGLREVTSLADLRDAIIDNYANGFRIWYRPEAARQAQIEAAHKVATLLRAIQEPRFEAGKAIPKIAFYVDEMSDVYPVEKLPADLRGLEWLSKAGRHFRIDFIGATQRPAQISSEFRGNAEIKYFLRLDSAPDLQAVAHAVGSKAKHMVEGLRNYQYVRYSEGEISQGTTSPI